MNISRLLEDLTATVPLLEQHAAQGRPIHPSVATLEAIGKALTSSDQIDEASVGLRNDPWSLTPLVRNGHFAVLSGRVRVNYILASIAFAQTSLRPRFVRGTEINWLPMLRWILLYGVDEHRLWSFLSKNFVAELSVRTIRASDGYISPIQLCLMHECPEICGNLPAAGSDSFHQAFRIWMQSSGINKFKLFWLLPRAELLTYVASALHSQVPGASEPQEILSNPNNKWRLPDEPRWSNTIRPSFRSGPREESRFMYRSFGEDFPSMTISCCDSAFAEASIRPGAIRQIPGTASVELLDFDTQFRLPNSWVLPSILLIHLEVDASIRSKTWVRLSIGEICVDARPALVFAGAPLKILIADRIAANPLLMRIQLEESFPKSAGGQRIQSPMRLFMLQFWNLP